MCTLISCQKQDASLIPANVEAEQGQKVLAWLDRQSGNFTRVVDQNSISALKKSLLFSRMRIENINNDQQLVIIPIADSFRTFNAKKAPQPAGQKLLVIRQTGDQTFSLGHIVELTAQGSQSTEIPQGLIHKLQDDLTHNYSGTFRLLTINNYLLVEKEFAKGKLISLKNIDFRKQDETTQAAKNYQTLNDCPCNCIDWYEVTYYIDEWNNMVIVDEVYLMTTCDWNLPGGGGGGESGDGSTGAPTGTVDTNVTEILTEQDMNGGIHIPDGVPSSAPEIIYYLSCKVQRQNDQVVNVIRHGVQIYPVTTTYTDGGWTITRTMSASSTVTGYSLVGLNHGYATWSWTSNANYTYEGTSGTHSASYPKSGIVGF
ncbi:MAG: hypothetical protein DI535_10150 [Citrobacter freundii]|nr:MAG: hypothetical protein DI535_10150 [Citrobacter freundii]